MSKTPAYLTIGFEREDGDFQVLATLNNADNLMDEGTFDTIARGLTSTLANATDEPTKAVIRQDVPDYIEADDGEVFTESTKRTDDTVNLTRDNSRQFLHWLLSELHGGNEFSKDDYWKWAEQARAIRDSSLTQVEKEAPAMLEALTKAQDRGYFNDYPDDSEMEADEKQDTMELLDRLAGFASRYTHQSALDAGGQDLIDKAKRTVQNSARVKP